VPTPQQNKEIVMSQLSAMPAIELPAGTSIPVLGQGTWHMAEDRTRRRDEIASLKVGLDLGMTLIDTAEMYADGAAEELVGAAIAGRRDEVFLVSKVLPQHATRHGTIAACQGSLRRLATDRLDIYLLHWRGRIPLDETIAGFEALIEAGAIRHWGVSNFDVDDLEELVGLPGGSAVQVNQVLYNLNRRGVEYDLLPWCQERGIAVMAYSPVEQGRLLSHPILLDLAYRHEAAPSQIALAWVLRNAGVNAVPKAGTPEHVHEDRGAVAIRLTDYDLLALDAAFPPPLSKQPLAML
jgi:diketogulonate reductase-like aldo/keto reductase